MVIGEGLRLRQEPNVNAQILYKFSFGDEIRILEVRYDNHKYINTVNDIKNYWWKVEIKDNIIGWVFAEYIGYPYYKNENDLIAITWYLENKYDEFLKPLLRIYKEKNLITKYKYVDYNNESNEYEFAWSSGFKKKLKGGIARNFNPNKIEIDNINNLKVIKLTGDFYEGLEAVSPASSFISEVWFSFKNNTIKPIFCNKKMGLPQYHGSVTGIDLKKDDNGNIIQITQIYGYIPMNIDYDYFNSILTKLDEKDKETLKKYYYREDIPKFLPFALDYDNLKPYKEIKLTKEEKDLFNKFYTVGGMGQDESYLTNEKELTKQNKEKLKEIITKKMDYNWLYLFDINIPNDQLQEARNILKKVNYDFKDTTLYHIWNGEQFILKGEYPFSFW